MSSEAVRWVTKNARHVRSQLRYTLVVMASYADSDGRGMWPSASTLADDTGKSKRQIEKDLAELRTVGQLATGDQTLVAHLSPTTRPVVYDLLGMAALASVTSLSGRTKRRKGSDEACPVHPGQKASACGPCRSERIAAN